MISDFQVDFEIVWQTRESEEIRFADKVSKDFDFGDYRISKGDFNEVIARYSTLININRLRNIENYLNSRLVKKFEFQY